MGNNVRMLGLVAVLVVGLVVGSIYALTALGLVLTYRTSGVVNFAQGAMGMVGAFAYYQLVRGGPVRVVVFAYTQRWRLPTAVAAAVIVAVVGPLVGWAVDAAMMRRLRDAQPVVPRRHRDAHSVEHPGPPEGHRQLVARDRRRGSRALPVVGLPGGAAHPAPGGAAHAAVPRATWIVPHAKPAAGLTLRKARPDGPGSTCSPTEHLKIHFHANVPYEL